MKKKGEPLATIMAFTTLTIVGVSARRCMKKYGNVGMPKHGILVKKRKRSHAWKVV